jgi:uncharacterized protein YjbJ (UPF0337 family)
LRLDFFTAQITDSGARNWPHYQITHEQYGTDCRSVGYYALLLGLCSCLEEEIMDKDRVVGSAKQVKGAVKRAIGKAVGDAKLESEGKADKIEGKAQNAVGGLKDTLKGK